MELDYLHQKLNTRVASIVAKYPKYLGNLANLKKISETSPNKDSHYLVVQNKDFNSFATKLRKKSAIKLSIESSISQSAITCSKLTTETLEQGVKYVQS